MNISDLFQTVPSTPKPPPLGPNQFEFIVDRNVRRIRGAIGTFFGAGETLRVQANRPFTWTGRIELPDTSLGDLRVVRAEVDLHGSLPASEAAVRALLTRLLLEQFSFDRLFQLALGEAITRQRMATGGGLIAALRADPAAVQSAIVMFLRDDGLPVDRVIIRPVSYDTRPTLDLVDVTDGIEVRSRGALEANRIAYKARLVWGKSPEQVLGRLAYNGAVEGRQPGRPLTQVLVAGQIQPLEAWFRRLLTEALGSESRAAVAAGDARMIDNVKAAVSVSLGLGTGRIVDELVVYPVRSDLPQIAERSLRFRANYTILGVRGEGLEIEHAVRFVLIDRDRWIAQNSPEPEAFVREQVIEATRVFLHNKRFEDVVGFYVGQDGESQLGNAVASRVAPIAASIGYRLVSLAAILAIPEIDFIQGREIAFEEDAYQLADPNLQPKMLLNVKVRVHEGDEARFAKALARQEGGFEDQIRPMIVRTVRAALRGRAALEYYGSPFVNGVAIAADGTGTSWRAETPECDPFTLGLREKLDQALRDQFGLELVDFGLKPGFDPIIERIKGITNLPLRHYESFTFQHIDPRTAVDQRIAFDPRTDLEQRTAIRMDVDAEIFITGIAPEYWTSFYHSVPRYATTQDHANEIRQMFSQTMRMAEHAIVAMASEGQVTGQLPELLIHAFADRIRQSYGLEARLRPLKLWVHRPRADQSTGLILQELDLELRRLLERRRAIVETTTDDEISQRDSLNRRIQQVREEMKAEAAQHDREIGQTVSVRASQNLLTGRFDDDDLTKPGSADAG
jgi:hypothetical protein